LEKHSLDNFFARGRYFTSHEINQIVEITNAFFSQGLTSISRELCSTLNWYQDSGRPKDVACREALRKLEGAGVLDLPIPRKSKSKNYNPLPSDVSFPSKSICAIDFTEIKFERVTDQLTKKMWNQLISDHHYLHTCKIVGRQIKYFATIHDQPIACFGWADAAWTLKARDQWIEWDQCQLAKNRHLIINNVRFLILPWVKIPNLASHLLSRCASIVSGHWLEGYGFRPVLLETFVDKSRFPGTCYRAANWIEIGSSAGYAKVGSFHHNSQGPKAIFVLPLRNDFRQILKGN